MRFRSDCRSEVGKRLAAAGDITQQQADAIVLEWRTAIFGCATEPKPEISNAPTSSESKA